MAQTSGAHVTRRAEQLRLHTSRSSRETDDGRTHAIIPWHHMTTPHEAGAFGVDNGALAQSLGSRTPPHRPPPRIDTPARRVHARAGGRTTHDGCTTHDLHIDVPARRVGVRRAGRAAARRAERRAHLGAPAWSVRVVRYGPRARRVWVRTFGHRRGSRVTSRCDKRDPAAPRPPSVRRPRRSPARRSGRAPSWHHVTPRAIR